MSIKDAVILVLVIPIGLFLWTMALALVYVLWKNRKELM